MGLPDHFKQGVLHALTVNLPARVEDPMSAMLRVHLREHHQFSIRWISVQLAIQIMQIIQFIRIQRAAELPTGPA